MARIARHAKVAGSLTVQCSGVSMVDQRFLAEPANPDANARHTLRDILPGLRKPIDTCSDIKHRLVAFLHAADHVAQSHAAELDAGLFLGGVPVFLQCRLR